MSDAMRQPALIRLSVRPSRSFILSKWQKISPNFFLGPVAPSF